MHYNILFPKNQALSVLLILRLPLTFSILGFAQEAVSNTGVSKLGEQEKRYCPHFSKQKQLGEMAKGKLY